MKIIKALQCLFNLTFFNKGAYEESLDDHPDFLRIHRAFIINKNCVVAILKNDKRNMIQLTDGTELEISPSLVISILDLLNL